MTVWADVTLHANDGTQYTTRVSARAPGDILAAAFARGDAHGLVVGDILPAPPRTTPTISAARAAAERTGTDGDTDLPADAAVRAVLGDLQALLEGDYPFGVTEWVRQQLTSLG